MVLEHVPSRVAVPGFRIRALIAPPPPPQLKIIDARHRRPVIIDYYLLTFLQV